MSVHSCSIGPHYSKRSSFRQRAHARELNFECIPLWVPDTPNTMGFDAVLPTFLSTNFALSRPLGDDDQ